MPEARQVRVTPDEWRLLTAIRDVPEGPLREAFEEVIEHLADVIRDPRCPEMQADGVPCTSLGKDCEHCLDLEAMLESVLKSLPR